MVKWLLPEADSPIAVDFLIKHTNEGDEFLVPALCMVEVPSAILRKVRKGQATIGEAHTAVEDFHSLLAVVTVIREDWELVQRAWDIASSYRLGRMYDSVYLALAERFGAECWTADGSFHSAVGADFPRLKLLSSYQP